jgi:hypothetical protein
MPAAQNCAKSASFRRGAAKTSDPTRVRGWRITTPCWNARKPRHCRRPSSKRRWPTTRASSRNGRRRSATTPKLKKLETDLRDLRTTRADAAMAAAGVVAVHLLRPHVLAAVRVKMNGVEGDAVGGGSPRRGAHLPGRNAARRRRYAEGNANARPVTVALLRRAGGVAYRGVGARNGNRNTDARQHQPARPRRHAPSRNKRRRNCARAARPSRASPRRSRCRGGAGNYCCRGR